jgi:hypothetical protein
MFWGPLVVGLCLVVVARLNANLLPNWLLATLLLICAGCLTANRYLSPLISSYVLAKPPVRTPIAANSLPARHQKCFAAFETVAARHRMIFQGDFLTNPRLRTATRDYLTHDRQTVVRLICGDAVSAICVQTLLADGRVITTHDIEVSYPHPMMEFHTGVQGDLEATLGIHNQAIAPLAESMFSVADDELADVVEYLEEIECQCVGKRPQQQIPIPHCRSLKQRTELQLVSAES